MSDTIDELVDEPVLRQRLHRQLEHSADAVEIRRTPVTSVIRRADMRRRRQRVGEAFGAVCLIVGAVGAAIAGRSDDRTIVNLDEPPTLSTESVLPLSTFVAPSTTAGDAAAPATTAVPVDDAFVPFTTAVSAIVDTPFEWQSVTPDAATSSALDFMSSSYNDRGTLGWTYNESSPSDWVSSVFISDDGIAWTATPTSPGLSVVGGIDTTDGIHVVGYASSADPDAGKVFVATSQDRGATWRRDPLPFDLSPAWDSDSLSVRLYPSEMASVGGTIVVAIQPMSMLLPSALGDSMYTSGFVYLDDGVGVLRSCDGCPVGGPLSEYDGADIERIISWEELGVTDGGEALLHATPSVHVSGPDGYREVEVPFAEEPSGFWLSSTLTSILAVEQRIEPAPVGLLSAPARLYESTDGRSWRLVGEAPLQTGRAGRIDGRYVVVGAGLETGDTGIASSADGVSWTIHPLPPDPSGETWGPFYDMAAFDDDTLAIAGFEMLEPPELRLTENGVTMIFDAGLNDMLFIDDATGVEIASARDEERYGPVRLDDGPTLSVLDDAGEVRAQFSLEEATAAMQATPGPVPRVAIYTTNDLTTWSRTILNDVVTDSNVTLNAVDLVDDRLIVRVGVDRDGDPATFESDPLLAVGTRIR